MANSPYERIMRRPREGLVLRYAYYKHMTEWADLLDLSNQEHQLIAYRIRELKWDALDQNFFYVGSFRFPVFFYVEPDAKERTEERNFECMLITTDFPLIPSNEIGKVYPFDPVEHAVSLSWLNVPGVKSVSDTGFDVLLKGVPVAMREKIDGYPLVTVQVGGAYYLVGRHWYETAPMIRQVELDRSTNKAHIVEPALTEGFFKDGLNYVPHLPRTYDPSEMSRYKEGAMVFFDYMGVISEYRVKRRPTVEIQVRDNQSCLGPLEVPDGVWEVYSEGPGFVGPIIPIRQRRWKNPCTKDQAQKSLCVVHMDMLPKYTKPSVDYLEGPEHTWGMSKGKIVKFHSWTYRVGILRINGLQVGTSQYSSVVDVGKTGYYVLGKSVYVPSDAVHVFFFRDGDFYASDSAGNPIRAEGDIYSVSKAMGFGDLTMVRKVRYKGSEAWEARCKHPPRTRKTSVNNFRLQEGVYVPFFPISGMNGKTWDEVVSLVRRRHAATESLVLSGASELRFLSGRVNPKGLSVWSFLSPLVIRHGDIRSDQIRRIVDTSTVRSLSALLTKDEESIWTLVTQLFTMVLMS